MTFSSLSIRYVVKLGSLVYKVYPSNTLPYTKPNNSNINLVLLNKIGSVNFNCQFTDSKINRFLKIELVN